MPPVADAALPWDRELDDPVAALAAARAACGDTFVVDGPDHPTLFLFSPEGVRSFYALPEAAASKGVADWMMLRRKLPDGLFDGRRTMPHALFGREDVVSAARSLDPHRCEARSSARNGFPASSSPRVVGGPWPE